jgi:hypothetical protein
MFYRSAGQVPLALTEVGFQQFENVSLNPGSAVALGEISSQLIHTETDFVLLVGFGFPENLKDFVYVQFSGLAQFLELDSLRERWCAVFAFHGFQKVTLFLPG